MSRREFVTSAAATAGGLGLGCTRDGEAAKGREAPSPILGVEALGAPPWRTEDPFLFCVHHLDRYPAGDPRMGPTTSLAGRSIGMDFSGKDGWSMYHGSVVPGFPRHPHRGFETVTVTRQGHIDHSDSMGATARYGEGDVQWMTAGRGIEHAEMFPLRKPDAPNPTELFQIWLNLPAASKMVQPHFSMLWADEVPRHRIEDEAGRVTEVVTIAGALGERRPPKPPPSSWAAKDEAKVAIWSVSMSKNAQWTLPAADADVKRNLYVFDGDGITIGGQRVRAGNRVSLRPEVAARLEAGAGGAQALLLEGRPIAEPVAQHGPFVMNTREELAQAYADYQRGLFGRWPWPSTDHVHPRDEGRFARHADGRLERPPGHS